MPDTSYYTTDDTSYSTTEHTIEHTSNTSSDHTTVSTSLLYSVYNSLFLSSSSGLYSSFHIKLKLTSRLRPTALQKQNQTLKNDDITGMLVNNYVKIKLGEYIVM